MSAAAVIVVVMASAPSAQGRTKVLGFSDAGKAALTQQMDDAVKRGDTPGVAELVVDRQGILFEGAAGKADIEQSVAMRTNAIFNIASMTKPVTSVAIMMLMEQGKLKLDDPVLEVSRPCLRAPAGHLEVQRQGRDPTKRARRRV